MEVKEIIEIIKSKYRYFNLDADDFELIITELVTILNKYNLKLSDLESIGEGESSIVLGANNIVVKLSYISFK